MNKKILSLPYVLIPFSYYYLGPLIFATYLYSFRQLFSNWRRDALLSVFIVLSISFILLVRNDIYGSVLAIRYFWGWIFFYIFFSSDIRIDVYTLLKILSVLTIGEAIIINTLVSPADMPNYPSSELAHHNPADIYQRPYSFGGSASVTSGILVILMAHLRLNFRLSLLPILGVVSCMSGTGFLLLFLLLIYNNSKGKYMFFAALVLLLSSFIFLEGIIYKFSIEYFGWLVDDKLAKLQASDIFTNLEYFFFGVDFFNIDGVGGDSQFQSFLEINGIIGVLALVLVLALNLNRLNWGPIFLMLLGSFHYGVVWYFPGQFLFGYFLALRPNFLDRSDLISLGYKFNKI